MSEKEAVVEETDAQRGNAQAEVEKRTEEVTDFDALLSQFEQGTKAVDSPPEPKITDLSKFKEQIKSELLAEQQTASAVKNLVKSVRGEISDEQMTDEEIEDWLEGQAKRNEQLRMAWLNRAKNPGDWKKIEAGLSNKLNGKFKNRIDPEATADKEAVAQAVRGASTKVAAEPAPDFSKMSDAELRNYTQQHYGYS